MFERILIACRGEVGARVARTCRRLGLDTVAVHVAGEQDEVHVEACDEAIEIGSEAVAYADPDLLVAAAAHANVGAVHTGYGLGLDEARLARALADREIAYVGAHYERLEASFDLLRVRAAADDAGVRVIAAEGPLTDAAAVGAAIDALGAPVVLRPARCAREPDEILLASEPIALAEPHVAERYLERPRHVEVQLLSDGQDAVVLGDWECSLRKGHHRVAAEAPARALDALPQRDAVRGAVWDASIEITTRLGLAGLVTCHYLLDADGVFFFVGARAGLQEEHVLTEMCTALDLVELQLRVASGEGMPPEALRAEPTGAAFQARVDASADPRTGRPFESRVDAARWPPAPPGKVRLEAGVKNGSAIAQAHDPLIATVTTYAPTRHDALLMLDRIIAEIHLAPLVTNLRLLRKALNHESLRAGQYDEGLLDRI